MEENLEKIATIHYENFPVGSWFVPKKMREPIHLIYAFARVADDIADEGNRPTEERLQLLENWEKAFRAKGLGKGNSLFFKKLWDQIENFHLPEQYFLDLLIAFKQDSANPHYRTFSELEEYCRYSANPIGRLLLVLFQSSNELHNRYSDSICTALQLTNFWQDISVDTLRNRIYIPLNELERCGLDIPDLRSSGESSQFSNLIHRYVDHTRELFQQGKPLLGLVHKDFQFELKLIWHGGMRILEKIEILEYDTRRIRPTLTAIDLLRIFSRALRT